MLSRIFLIHRLLGKIRRSEKVFWSNLKKESFQKLSSVSKFVHSSCKLRETLAKIESRIKLGSIFRVRVNHQSDAPRPNSPFPRSNASSPSPFFHSLSLTLCTRHSPLVSSLSLPILFRCPARTHAHTPPRGSIQTWLVGRLSCRYSVLRSSSIPEKALTKPRQRGGSPLLAQQQSSFGGTPAPLA